ncbi:MAG TPA: hypothetical protein VI199_07965 [Novosphingobium sp.]
MSNMHDDPQDDDLPPVDPTSPEYLALRAKVIRQRNIAVGLLLACLVVLFFAITIVKMKI